MLKSYRDLTRWYGPLEPDESAPADSTDSIQDAAPTPIPDAASVSEATPKAQAAPIAQAAPDAQAAPPIATADPEAQAAPDAPQTPTATGAARKRPVQAAALPASNPKPMLTSTPAWPRARERELVGAGIVVEPPRLGDAAGHRAGYVGGWNAWMDPADEPDRGPADLIELTPAAPRTRPRPSRRTLLILAVALGALLLAGLCFAALSGGGKPAAAGPSTPTQTSGVPGCSDQNTGTVVTGAGPGGTGSGPDAILWFQHSWYVERSAARARQVVGPDATVPSLRTMQRSIDEVPPGTVYCAQVTSIADGRYAVALTQIAPGQPAQQYKEIVTTTVTDGRTVITGIASG